MWDGDSFLEVFKRLVSYLSLIYFYNSSQIYSILDYILFFELAILPFIWSQLNSA